MLLKAVVLGIQILISVAASSRRSLENLPTPFLRTLANLRDPATSLDFNDPSSHLSFILRPRAPGTKNNTMVKNYFVDKLKALNWHVEEDTFTDVTPIGKKTFTNVIATKNPDATRRLVLAAHFDSKYFAHYPQNQFVGATDSAAPCAILLDVAESLNALLDARQKKIDQGLEDDDDLSDTTLQLLFLDGEEAFKDWTSTDSIYGARHLAEKWDNTFLTPSSKRPAMPPLTQLSTIEHFVLLDLLGSKEPIIRSYFLTTGWLFDALASTEHRLGAAGVFKEFSADPTPSFFTPREETDSNFGYIEDDHIPFLKRGVPVLHVIASPFPSVWHTLADDASALDMPTLIRWAQMFRLFTAEYFNLRPEKEISSREHGELSLPLLH